MSTKIRFYLFFTLLSILSYRVHATDQPIHFVKSQQSEFVSGGGIETITLEISAPSFNAPFLWSVKIQNANGTLLSVERNDSWLDSFFENNDYVANCNGYKECKEKWYFSELVTLVTNAAKVASARSTPPEAYEIETLEHLAEDYLKAKNVEKPRIRATISEMKILLANGYSMFSVPISPVEEDSSLMYVESLNYFVPYWND